MKNCGTCEYFSLTDKPVGWQWPADSGECMAPVAHGHIFRVFQKLIITKKHGTECPVYKENKDG